MMAMFTRITVSRAALEALLLLLIFGCFAVARPSAAMPFALCFMARRKTAVMCVGVLALLISIGFAAVHGPPIPAAHDDFSNLLLADTLLKGRLANPTHPMWPHFETFYVLQHPT